MINIGRGNGILKDIAKLICKKYNKKCTFIDNKKQTYLIANNKKLKKYHRFKKNIDLKDLILVDILHNEKIYYFSFDNKFQ